MTFSTRPDSGEDEGVCSQVQQHQARQVFQVAPGGGSLRVLTDRGDRIARLGGGASVSCSRLQE